MTRDTVPGQERQERPEARAPSRDIPDTIERWSPPPK